MSGGIGLLAAQEHAASGYGLRPAAALFGVGEFEGSYAGSTHGNRARRGYPACGARSIERLQATSLKKGVLMSTVNPQVTDAVTQSNVRANDNAADIALRNLYQVAAQAMGNAAMNAVSSQEQSTILAQAATTQGVLQLYENEMASQGPALEGEPSPSASPAAAILSSADALAQRDGASGPKNVVPFDHVAPWSHAARELMATVASTLHEFQKVSQEANMAILKQAAIAATLAHMLKAPDQLEQYQKILALIEAL
jgi:hypothetical protein